MNSQRKASIIALLLVATNWHWSSKTQKPNMTSSVHMDGASIGLLVCAVVLVVLVVRLYRLLRVMLDEPVRVPGSTRLASWEPVFILLLLLISVGSTTTTSSGDATTTISRGYGCEASLPLFFVAGAMLLTWQVLSELRRLSGHNPSASSIPSQSLGVETSSRRQ